MLFQFRLFFCCVLTFVILYRIIKYFFSDKVTYLTCICLFIGTMIPFFTVIYPSYSHIYGLFMNSLFMYYVICYENKYYKRTSSEKILLDLGLGLILGLICLIRYTNFIMLLTYIFYNVFNINDLKKRLTIIFSKKLFYQIVTFLFIVLIQVILYKISTGRFMFNGYAGEEFPFLLNPQIFYVLFSDTKGLFIFCPLLFIGFLSMLLLSDKNNPFKFSQLLIFLIVTYIISSWWCWWLAHGYTIRIYCDIICIFAIPIATVINLIFQKRIQSFYRYVISFSVIIFTFLNLLWINGVVLGNINSNLASWYMLNQYIYSFFQ